MQAPGPERERLTPQRKLELVLASYRTDNVAEFARESGIDRSYLYQLRREHETAALRGWEETAVGRPPKPPSPPQQDSGLAAELKRAQEEARLWQFQARVLDLVLHAFEKVGAVKKTPLPPFWTTSAAPSTRSTRS